MKDTLKWSAGTIALGAVVIVVVIALAAMAIFGFGLFNRSTANFRGQNQQIEQTKANGQYRIAAYDHFYDLCASIQDDEASIQNLKDELATKPPTNRVTQIQASITAVKNGRRSKINEYNADARKAGTIGQFRGSGLPFSINPKAEETTCNG